MVDVCAVAGCSRATLYRYFPNQQALHHAYVNRAVLRIAARLAGERGDATDSDPSVMVDRIVGGIQAVRADPLLAVWFEPENVAVPMALSQDSELLHTMGAAFVGELTPTARSQVATELRGEWLLRSIVSLLAMPAADAATERMLIESFVLPVLSDDPQRSIA